MKTAMATIALAAFIATLLPVDAQSNPVSKAVELLSGLQAKIIKEGEGAQKIYAEFSEWCEDRSAELHYEIKTAKAGIAEAKATIEKATADIATKETQIGEYADSIAVDEKDLKGATAVRTSEKADFDAEEKDLLETINTIERAVTIIERDGASFAQFKSANGVVKALSTLVQASSISSLDASRLTALVQSDDEDSDSDADEDPGAPDPSAYEDQSGTVVETLTNLLDKAQSQLSSSRQTEASSLHNYEMLKQTLEDKIKFANKDMDKAKKALAAAKETKATAEGNLDITTKDMKEDVADLEDLHHECMSKATDFEEETKSRGDELNALAAAKKAVVEMTGGATEQTYSLQQTSFVQVSMSTKQNAQFAAVKFVRKLARKEHSTMLTQLAMRMASALHAASRTGADPFAKVKGLLYEMIEKLESEASQDAKHKAWCDKEMGETTAKKEDNEAEIEKMSTKIDKMTSRSAKLKEEIAILQKELASLQASQLEMDKLRAEEKALYETNKPEMELGVEGIQKALQVLRDYYAMDDKDHEAAEGAGTGIIGLLEVAESDFSKGLAEMIAEEKTAEEEYDDTTKENEITKVTKEQDVKYKTKEATELDEAVVELTSDREGVQSQLSAVLEYMKSLEESCVAKPDTYEERKQRREAELAGLKEALEILSGEPSLLQKQSVKRILRGHGKLQMQSGSA